MSKIEVVLQAHGKEQKMKLFLASSLVVAIGFGALIFGSRQTHQACTFDRNELGPVGSGGQWYWDIFKCADGTERRLMVAGPRG